MTKFGLPVGPVTLTDEVGVDVAAHVADFLGQHLGDRMRGPDGEMLQEMVRDGALGRKAGKGFFVYGDKKGKREINPDASRLLAKYREGRAQAAQGLSDDELRSRMVARFVNEAALWCAARLKGGRAAHRPPRPPVTVPPSPCTRAPCAASRTR